MDRGFEFELDELLRASAYVLGKGGLGIVYKVVLGNGVPVAVRRLGEGGGQRYKEFAAEVQAIAKARHPNVVRLRAYYWAQDEKLLISDFISNGNLFKCSPRFYSTMQLSNLTRFRMHDMNRTVYPVEPNLVYSASHSSGHGPWAGLSARLQHKKVHPRRHQAIQHPARQRLQLLHLRFGSQLSRLHSLYQPSAVIPPLLPSSPPRPPPLGLSAAPPILSPFGPQPAQPICSPRGPSTVFPPDAEVDVYSFGIVLLEMLTGRHPERRPHRMARWEGWVRIGFEEARSLAEMVDLVLLREMQSKKEVLSAFHVALSCTEPDPEVRPRMKSVLDSLDRIGQ
ncbi:hypothetical protein HPP92_023343 [Vanilla planifolia]|uniref:Protein kinase domain-containing protein n=1 Tax=Vanilla planifolia TaxID=51239 RepID=A0A835UG61_VANPL|nr:hypothetical protein HPP92_023343 [Vanilla planifolia]